MYMDVVYVAKIFSLLLYIVDAFVVVVIDAFVAVNL